jgi:integrase
MKKPLTYAFISKDLPPGRYFDSIGNLHLYVKDSGRKYWIFRYTHNKKPGEKCLGSFPDLGLSEARDLTVNLRADVKRGILPKKTELTEQIKAKPTFRQVAEDYIKTHSPKWKNEKHVSQWSNTLRDYVYPFIGEMPVDEITLEHILQILKPIWVEKTETASRVRGRIEKILGSSTVLGLRSGHNPAQWRGYLEHILPATKSLKKVEHHPALPYRQVNAFLLGLHKKECLSALALEFLILTATRTGEVLFAKWSEIDGDVWIIPANRMKAKVEHRVPLTQRCLEILTTVRSIYGESEHIFHRGSKPMSNAAMSKLLDGLAPGYTVHGFRSTFRDWVAEETEHSGDVAEMALAHKIASSVEASYRRGNLMARRRRLMEDWETYCSTSYTDNVINFDRKVA